MDKTDWEQLLSTSLQSIISPISSIELSFPPKISTKISDPYNLIINIIYNKPYAIKFALAVIFSGLSHLSLRIYVSQRLKTSNSSNPYESQTLLRLLDEKAGIKRIYEGKIDMPAIKQHYVLDMMNELTHVN